MAGYDNINEIIAYESGTLDQASTVALFQRLVNSGDAWRLQSHYGRMADHLIKQGLVSAARRRA